MLKHPRSMKKMAIAAVAAGVLVVGTACSAGGGSAGGSTPQDLSQSASAFLKKAGKSLKTKSINILAGKSPQVAAIKDISQQFTSLTGIKVNWTVLDEQSSETKGKVALGNAKGAFDVIEVPSELIPSYTGRGWLASIDKLAKNKKLHVPGWDETAYGKGLTNLLRSNGELYGVPIFIGTQVFWYRTDIFKKAGITSTPKTFSELIQDVRKIKACSECNGIAGIALRSAPSVSQVIYSWSAWLYAYGGKYYKSYKDGAYSGSALNSPEALKALEVYSDFLNHDAPNGATNWSAPDVTRAFSSGRAAIIQEGAVFGGLFNDPKKSQVAGKVGTFPIPAGPAGQFVPWATQGWMIAANSSAKKAAWLFTQWATLKKTLVAATRTDAGFAAPPLSSVYASAKYKEKYGFDHYVATVQKTIDIANNGGVSPLKGDPNYEPGDPDWATTGQQIAQELSKAITGEESPAKALQKAATYLK